LFSVGCGDYVETSAQKKLEQQIPYYTPEDGSNAIEVMRNGDVWLGNYNEGIKIYDGTTKASDLAVKSEIPTKISQIENDVNLGSISVVNHGTSDTNFELTPNVFHKWDTVSELTLTLAEADENIYNEYMF
jgi:hypothetical protein